MPGRLRRMGAVYIGSISIFPQIPILSLIRIRTASIEGIRERSRALSISAGVFTMLPRRVAAASARAASG